MNESEIASLIGTRDGYTIASRLLQMLDTGELDPAKAEDVDRAVQRITGEVLDESVRKYGEDTISVEGDPYVVAAREVLRESISRGLRGVFSRPPNRSRISKGPVVASRS